MLLLIFLCSFDTCKDINLFRQWFDCNIISFDISSYSADYLYGILSMITIALLLLIDLTFQ